MYNEDDICYLNKTTCIAYCDGKCVSIHNCYGKWKHLFLNVDTEVNDGLIPSIDDNSAE